MGRTLLMVLLLFSLLLGRLPFAQGHAMAPVDAHAMQEQQASHSHDCCEDNATVAHAAGEQCASGCDHGAGHCNCHHVVMVTTLSALHARPASTSLGVISTPVPPTQLLSPPERPPRLA